MQQTALPIGLRESGKGRRLLVSQPGSVAQLPASRVIATDFLQGTRLADRRGATAQLLAMFPQKQVRLDQSIRVFFELGLQIRLYRAICSRITLVLPPKA